jgi:hypothetical protein
MVIILTSCDGYFEEKYSCSGVQKQYFTSTKLNTEYQNCLQLVIGMGSDSFCNLNNIMEEKNIKVGLIIHKDKKFEISKNEYLNEFLRDTLEISEETNTNLTYKKEFKKVEGIHVDSDNKLIEFDKLLKKLKIKFIQTSYIKSNLSQNEIENYPQINYLKEPNGKLLVKSGDVISQRYDITELQCENIK